MLRCARPLLAAIDLPAHERNRALIDRRRIPGLDGREIRLAGLVTRAGPPAVGFEEVRRRTQRVGSDIEIAGELLNRGVTAGLVHSAISTTAIFDQRERRMTRVAATVLRAHIHDDRFRTVSLDLQCGVERVLCVCDDVMGLSVQLEPHGKLHLTTLHAARRLRCT